jgi:hypothetical protein
MTKTAVVAYYTRDQLFRTVPVKNLGWLFRHAQEATALHAFRYEATEEGPDKTNLLRVFGRCANGDQWVYRISFASWSVLKMTVSSRRFSHLIHEDDHEDSAIIRWK